MSEKNWKVSHTHKRKSKIEEGSRQFLAMMCASLHVMTMQIIEKVHNCLTATLYQKIEFKKVKKSLDSIIIHLESKSAALKAHLF